MKTSPRGIALICDFEGFRSEAYQDVVGVWTIGYGFTKGVKPGDTITKAAAKARLQRELAEYEQGVMQATGGNVNQNQFDSLVSFSFNVGVAGMKRSSVIKAHNRGDFQAAGRAFSLWNRAGNRVWPGLTRRRAAEAALYLEPEPDDVSDPLEGPRLDMPQQVDPESRMAGSSINRAAVATGAGAGVAAVAEVASAVQQTKSALDGLGTWLIPLLLLAVVGLAGYIVWQRVLQRRGGWA
jgi:lysozyme